MGWQAKRYTYKCPNASTCPRHKKCHVLTTTVELPVLIPVMQQCPAAGRMSNGKLKEILIYIGKAA